MSLAAYPAVVIVFAQDGCPACASYVPKFRRIAAGFGSIPSMVVNAGRHTRAADGFKVTSTPMTYLLGYGRILGALDGDAPVRDIRSLFAAASSRLGA